MKNTIFPISIFLCVFLFVFFANSSLLTFCDNLIDMTDEIQSLIEANDFESAQSRAQDIITFIDEKTIVTSIYVNHTDFDNFMEEAQELYIYTKCEDYMESLIATNSLQELSNNIKHLYQTKIENIL